MSGGIDNNWTLSMLPTPPALPLTMEQRLRMRLTASLSANRRLSHEMMLLRQQNAALLRRLAAAAASMKAAKR